MRLILFLIAAFVWTGGYADEPEKTVIVLPAGQIYEGDFFAVGRSVEISGTVNGDVYVFAEQAMIDGTVNGDVLGSGGSIDISGHVMRNCRLCAGQILLSGQVGGNVSAVAGNLQLLSSSNIEGNLVAVAGNIDLGATIDQNASFVASNARVSSHIHQNLQGYVGKMRLTSKAIIDGNVDYRSNTAALIDSGAVIRGTIEYHPSIVHKMMEGTWLYKVIFGSQLLALLMNFIYTFVVGILLMKLFPGNLQTTLHYLKNHTWKSFFYGVLLIIVLPLVFLLLLITILGVPFALTLLAANVIGFYTAKVYVIFWGSNWLFGKMGLQHSHILSFFLGVILYFLITSIPGLGHAITLAALLLGLGAGVVAQTKGPLFRRSSS